MINSWKDFLIAVEDMRDCQKEYFRTRSTIALSIARKREEVVDAAIRKKRTEWERLLQPEIY